ncbi:MAG: orotate phosphoribosyltransferase [Deltaproteobacteria bacterium]|nr:orotate phosphoribosyltransferase [Deltaproteobacteria bacterium]
MDYKQKLLDILYEYSFKYDPHQGFKLACGKTSDVYIDSKKTTYRADAMEAIGNIFFEKIKDASVDGIGGLTLGADPIAYATALISNLKGKPLEVFVVRKEPKQHGTMQQIEGPLTKGAKVVVVDDVVTTGGSTIEAIKRAKEKGFEIKKVLVLVDRQEQNGLENIEREAGCEVEAIFTKEELLERLKKQGIKKNTDKISKRRGNTRCLLQPLS